MTTTIRRQATGEIAAGNAVISELDETLNEHSISIVFYSDAALTNIVDTSLITGTVIVQASETGEQYGSIHNGTIILGSSLYDRPQIGVRIESIRAIFVDIVGATHYKMIVQSSERNNG